MAPGRDDSGFELTGRNPSEDNDNRDSYDFPQNLSLLDGGAHDRRLKGIQRNMLILGVIAVVALVLAFAALTYAASQKGERIESVREVRMLLSGLNSSAKVEIETNGVVEKIAFGSCTSYYVGSQPIWEKGVIPSEPHAWIWLGDISYLDDPLLDCGGIKHPDCECKADFMRSPPHRCKAGDLDNAREKMHRQITLPGYKAFLDYMCPNYVDGPHFPPIGTDTEMCPRPIMGTYDDHDFGWNNGNKRLPQKHLMKQVYLDGIGEPLDSPRRSSAGGIEWKYVLNPDTDKQIDVILLDERYNRDTLPCHIRKKWCEKTLKNGTNVGDLAFCKDFLNGGHTGRGSCCKADDKWEKGWCKKGNKKDELYKVACDPLSDDFGSKKVSLGLNNGKLEAPASLTWDDIDEVSSFCDVLGREQRDWMATALQASDAPLTLIGSGSVLFGNSDYVSQTGPCSGDDWECYHPAQLNLLHMLNTMTTGCVVVLAGDYHMSDIKVLKPGKDSKYSEHYRTDALNKPIYQVMASGMTNVTAHYSNDPEPCAKWRKDTLGLRPKGECSAVFFPAFGMLEIDWENRKVHLQIRNETDGTKIAKGFDDSEMSLTFNLDTCQPV